CAKEHATWADFDSW
nr:immunoglobulin heavy chain junction region [Macaca mulatta]MOW75864.1 immunoglobulin heavy chain junction region [Macaca mulatta]MOW76067.1 immunoglobulin heavy chain junction region [Macaca mulatta]MOW76857.1 immunoglobulin heavy chain junction region [Macaca mulatta]MOW77307.1 immunoglobulin heavy chain junction region [Macaca mulatta]